jgi:hypothetical protein
MVLTTVAPPHITVGNMELIRRRIPTGTYCSANHPEEIEYRYLLVDGCRSPPRPKRSTLLPSRLPRQ